MKSRLTIVAVIWITCVIRGFAQDTNPPSPSSIGTQLQSYWASNQLSQIEVYVITLCTNYPNYVPAVLAKACYEGVYHSNVSNELALLDRVKNGSVGNDHFRALVSAERTQTALILDAYYREGTSHAALTNASTAQGVRNQVPVWPYLELITNAPNANLPSP